MKFTIEITQGSSPRKRLRRMRQHHPSEAAAIDAAEKLLLSLRGTNPKNPPEGYRVLDRGNKVITCGWRCVREE